MEGAQRELVSVLLDHIRALGLISHPTYLGALELVRSATNLPDFFRYPACLTEEASGYECAADTP